MARTQDEIQRSLEATLNTIDPSVDNQKGPVYNFMLRPVPAELQKTEADVQRMVQLNTIQLGAVATDDEVEAMATSFSLRRGGGKPSTTKTQVFFARRRPEEDVQIDRGVVVGTHDEQYTYFVSERVVMPVASIDNFYNPATRRYEISTRCEATAVGPDFDLPATRVSNLITEVTGIDGTTNTDKYQGGAIKEDSEATVNRIRAKFAGLDPESGGGIISDIANFDPENVYDVALVYPKDRSIFKRITNRPAIDVYVIGEELDTTTQSYIAEGGETEIVLESSPVRSVDQVLVNGSTASFSFIQDTSMDYGRSPEANDVIMLDTPLIAADVVTITYLYNKLLNEAQSTLFSLERPFGTSVLVREPRQVDLHIELEANILASFDPSRVGDEIEAKLFAEIEPDFFIDLLQPSIIRDRIRDDVAGISGKPRITTFTKVRGGVTDIETVDLAKNEVARIDQTILKIKVRR